MSLTLGMTGMDPATETALKAAFERANARLDGRWRLLPEGQAEHIMVDMDSMYGPMSWLRLHAAGKRVIGVTTAPRSQTDFHLGRPFDSDTVAGLLRSIADEKGIDLESSARIAASIAESAASPVPAAPAAPATSRASIERSEVAAPTMEAVVPVVDTAVEIPAAAPAVAVIDETANARSDTTSDPPPPVSEDPPSPPTVTPTAPKDSLVLVDWLAPGALTQRVRYRRSSGPTLLIDPVARRYHGPATLKPFAAYFEGAVRADDFETLDDASWLRDSSIAGAAHPLSRLEWLGGLLGGHGELLPGNDPTARYRLNKWPQTEREYPRHFRIATAMMKGPATLADIAVASDMPIADVADFINANLATGYAEAASEATPEPVEPAARPSGLFGRLRGRT